MSRLEQANDNYVAAGKTDEYEQFMLKGLMMMLEGLVEEWRERATTKSPLTYESAGNEIILLARQIQQDRERAQMPQLTTNTAAARACAASRADRAYRPATIRRADVLASRRAADASVPSAA